MPNVDWSDIGDIKHKIRNSLVKAVKLENLAKQSQVAAMELREEISGEIDKLDDIINKQDKEVINA